MGDQVSKHFGAEPKDGELSETEISFTRRPEDLPLCRDELNYVNQNIEGDFTELCAPDKSDGFASPCSSRSVRIVDDKDGKDSESPSLPQLKMGQMKLRTPSTTNSTPLVSPWHRKVHHKRIKLIDITQVNHVLMSFLNVSEACCLARTCKFWRENHPLRHVNKATICCITHLAINDIKVVKLVTQFGSALKELDLSLVSTVMTNRALIVVGRKCIGLRKLDITGCFEIRDEGIFGICAKDRGCRQLRELYMSNIPKITSRAVRALAHGCKHLEILHMAWNHLITWKIGKYLEKMTNLKEINLFETNHFMSYAPMFIQLEPRKRPLTLIGGLNEFAIHKKNLAKQIKALKEHNISFEQSEFTSVSDAKWAVKQKRFITSTQTIRMYAFQIQHSQKLYCVVVTEKGTFGLKLIRGIDFECSNEEIKGALLAAENKLEFLRDMVCCENWTWLQVFQNQRTLDMVGYENAEWISITTSDHLNDLARQEAQSSIADVKRRKFTDAQQ